MIEKTIRKFPRMIIEACSLFKCTRFYISHAFPCAKENISSSTSFNHSLCNVVMLVFVAVMLQLWTVVVPLEMCSYMVANISQIGTIRQVISTAVMNRTYPSSLRLNAVHDPYSINVPDNCRLPVNAMHNAFQCFVSWYRIAVFFHSGSSQNI